MSGGRRGENAKEGDEMSEEELQEFGSCSPQQHLDQICWCVFAFILSFPTLQ